ncbi:substrate-binding domain-containing protein [Planctopirus limnophila]|nr:substrate-binding domain-containing protein [Planctopirus limnophila]
MTYPISANQVRKFRLLAGLTQQQLAEQSGISRTAVTAIEGAKLVPSVAAALALSRTLGASVEDLFDSSPINMPPKRPVWAWQPPSFWQTSTDETPHFLAEVGGELIQYPASARPVTTPWPVIGTQETNHDPSRTLVLAGCDPAAGLLAEKFALDTGMHLLVIPRSSRAALDLVAQGKAHLAGLHFSSPETPDGNVQLARESLDKGFALLRLANWDEGVAVQPAAKLKTLVSIQKSRLTWVGREQGSGARRCFDQLFHGKKKPAHEVHNHRAVAEAIRSGFVNAGICHKLASAEAGLDFLPVQQEAYDLCIPEAYFDDDRVQCLIRVVQSTSYRKVMAQLPGYDTSETGGISHYMVTHR